MNMLFNRNPVKFGNRIDTPSQDAIENTFNLRQVSLEDAARYGGRITREALGAMNFHGDRKYIVVDTKVHFLLPGMYPSIPGWHTDGVPRGESLRPDGKGAPQVWAMERTDISQPRYHLLVTGASNNCQTVFLDGPIELNTVDLVRGGTQDLYANMTRMVNEAVKNGQGTFSPDEGVVVEWDWWTVHTAQKAGTSGWRYLIRVTETDYIKPRTSPSDFIRTQNNVYSPIEYGW